MGDHTDYNDGFVLPLAIDRECVVAFHPADTVRARSLDEGDPVELAADGSTDPSEVGTSWGRYLAGVVRELAARGRAPIGIGATIASDVPIGAGLSSSAALEVACAVALANAADWELEPLELALACRAAEEAATGVRCGIMDQLTSIAGEAGSALLIDCRSLERRPIPLPEDLRVLVVHSGIPRTLDASEYAERRRACEQIARRLGLRALRDATADEVADEPLARHVVSENARVLRAARALASGELEQLGGLFDESHASLRDDFAVSAPELDALVEELRSAGAYGARLTGAGFGGCVIAACESGREDAIAQTATAAYRAQTGLEPTAFTVAAAAGAGPL